MMPTSLITLLAEIVTENPWWLWKETRYISVRHDSGCKATGISGTCSCNPEIRLMHDAAKEQSLQGKVPNAASNTASPDCVAP